jgi:hypothetical protein
MLLMLKQTADSSDRSQVLDFGDERSLVELVVRPRIQSLKKPPQHIVLIH